jgi:hypothetical protein
MKWLIAIMILIVFIAGCIQNSNRTNGTGNSNSNTQAEKCVNSETIGVCLEPFHEDSSINITLDFTKIDLSKYASMGFVITGPGFHNNDAYTMISLENRIYRKVIANLEPDSQYSVCLSGINSDYTTTGYFDCAKFKTEVEKPATVIVFKNYDLEAQTFNLISEWLNQVKLKNPTLTIKEVSLYKGETTNEVLQIIREEYKSSNLKYAVLVGYDLPVPQITSWGENIYSVSPYTSISEKWNDFFNDNTTSTNQISVAVIRPEQKSEMVPYFERLINYYNETSMYDRKVLVANALIPSEGSITKDDFANSRYSASRIDYLGGINDYNDLSQASQWKADFSKYLSSNSYEFLIISAHGSREFHYPCDPQGCINSNFIDSIKPNVLFTIAVSCNIGNFMSVGSPMVSYVFSGTSLVGLGAETPFVDVNSQATKSVFVKVNENSNIADASRPMGFIIIGDPFLKLS